MKKEECNCACGCNNSFGVASVILGILSISLVFVVIIGSAAGLILGIMGLIFALMQRKRINNKWALWGIILSAIGILINGIILYQVLSVTIKALNQYQQLCTLAGGCDKVPAMLQAQQASSLANVA